MGPETGPVRGTSLEAWAVLKTGQKLPKARREVWRALMQFGPMTAGELTAKVARPGEKNTSYHKRLSELVALGCAVEMGTAECKVTGRRGIVWKAIPNPQVGSLPKGPTHYLDQCFRAFRKAPTVANREALKAAIDSFQMEAS